MLRQPAHFSKLQFLAVFFVLLLAVALLPAQPCRAGMQELADVEMSGVYATGFSTFTLDSNGLATVSFNNVTLRTWTEIGSMKTGYYNNGATTAWDNDWTTVSLGASGNDLIAQGLYIEAKFSNVDNPATRKLEYVRIGTTSLTGPVSGTFNSFSGSLDNGVTPYNRDATFGTTTITSGGGGFYMELSSSDDQRGEHDSHTAMCGVGMMQRCRNTFWT